MDIKSANAELTRDDLRTRYGVESEFVRVKELARIMGIAPTTIYTRMREGEFPLPMRRVGDMPLVRVDHLLAWLNAPAEAVVLGARTAAVDTSPVIEARALPTPKDRVQMAMDRARLSIEKARARSPSRPAARPGA